MERKWGKYFAEMQPVFQRFAAERTEDADRLETIIAELNRLLTAPISS